PPQYLSSKKQSKNQDFSHKNIRIDNSNFPRIARMFYWAPRIYAFGVAVSTFLQGKYRILAYAGIPEFCRP
ncbi:MAG: hypothetical protein FWC21_02965, partial [Treponema sp.]|nr:hypothetical protein [Treponema sp.]